MESAISSQVARSAISEVLAEFLGEQQKRLSVKTFTRYRQVIELLTDRLNNYAYQALSQSDAALFNLLYNAEGDEHREFCEIFGPEHILPNIGEFLGYFMIRKVGASGEFKRASGTVIKTLAGWLAQKGHVAREGAAEGAAKGARAAHDLPRAEALACRLMEYADKQRRSAEDDEGALEDHFTIRRVERGRIWLEAMDGNELGPIALPPALAHQCKVGWEIAGAVGRMRSGWRLLEVWNVYPN